MEGSDAQGVSLFLKWSTFYSNDLYSVVASTEDCSQNNHHHSKFKRIVT